jgi:hypothetical protein
MHILKESTSQSAHLKVILKEFELALNLGKPLDESELSELKSEFLKIISLSNL